MHFTARMAKGVEILGYTLLSSHTSLVRDNGFPSLREKHYKESSLYMKQRNVHKINNSKGGTLFL